MAKQTEGDRALGDRALGLPAGPAELTGSPWPGGGLVRQNGHSADLPRRIDEAIEDTTAGLAGPGE